MHDEVHDDFYDKLGVVRNVKQRWQKINKKKKKKKKKK